MQRSLLIVQPGTEGDQTELALALALACTTTTIGIQISMGPDTAPRMPVGTLPGGWVSATDLDLSLPHFSPADSSAAILPEKPFNLSPFPPSSTLPQPRSPALSKSSMSHLDRVVNFHRRLSKSLFSSDSPSSARRESKFAKPAVFDTPQSVPSLLEEGSSAATTPSLSALNEEFPPILPPLRFPTTLLPDDALSISSRVTRLSFGQSDQSFSPGSPFDSPSIDSGSIIDPGWDFSSPTRRHAYLRRSSSYQSSIIDAFPSSASIKRIPSIPSLSSEFQLHNLPDPAASSLLFESYPPYSYSTTGDIPAPSLFGGIPIISQTPSLTSLSDPFGHTAQQFHNNMMLASNPPASRHHGRVVVREHVHVEGDDSRIRKDTWTYGCETLPYSAGFRPHLYIDNSERPVSRKMSPSGHVASPNVDGEEAFKASRSPAKLVKQFVGRGQVSRFLGLRGTKKKRGRKCGKIIAYVPSTFPVSPFLDTQEVVTHDSPPSNTHKAGRANKRFSVSRSLSMFLVPKPRIELLDGYYHHDDLGLLDESFEAVSPPREEAPNGLNMSSELPSFFPAKKDMDVKGGRRKSWFNLTSSSSGPYSR